MYGTDCKSWGGQEHVKCLVSESLSLSDTVICTLPQYLPHSENNETGLKASYSCRNCSEPSEWRCDNGFCIKRDKLRDGIPDCDDGSDEHHSDLRMWNVIICTMLLTGGSIFASFIYRYFIGKVSSHFVDFQSYVCITIAGGHYICLRSRKYSHGLNYISTQISFCRRTCARVARVARWKGVQKRPP